MQPKDDTSVMIMKCEKGEPSEFLKDCMADAVMRLLAKYTLNEIQIKQICDAKGLDPLHILYVECNPNTNSKLSFYDEELFRVDFHLEDGMPTDLKYTQLTQDEIKKLV